MCIRDSLNDRSRIIINPPGITIGEVKQYANVRKKIQELNQGDESIELLGTIVQTFDPNFFNICPECNRKLEQIGEEFICKTHNKVTPATSYVLNLTLDDGSETVRCVFFKNQLERLLNKTPEEIIKYKDNPAEFEAVKTDLLGKQIKIIGRVSKNQMFDRLEFITQLVFPDPDTKQEIERLEKEKTNNTEEVKTEQEEVKTETENID